VAEIGTVRGCTIHGDPDVPGSWWCSCGSTSKAPCPRMRAVFRASSSGRVLREMRLTPEGLALALSGRCKCWRHGPLSVHPRNLPDYVPPPPEAPKAAEPRALPARNAPCPCGSGRKFKACVGTRAAPHPLGAPPQLAPPRVERPETPVEERRRKRAAEVDAILDRVRTKDEAQRAKRATQRAKKKAEAPAKKAPVKKAPAKKTPVKKALAKKTKRAR
jgi:SEC-C motif